MDCFLDRSFGKLGFDRTIELALWIAPGTGGRIGFESSDAVYAELHVHHSLEQLQAPINLVIGLVYVEGAMHGDAGAA